MNFIGMLEIPYEDRLMLNRLIGHYNYQNSLVNELTDDIENLSKTAVARELESFIWEAMIIYYQGEMKEAS